MEVDVDPSPPFSSTFFYPLIPVTSVLVPYTTQQAFVKASSFTSSLSQPPSGRPLDASALDTTNVRPSTSTMSAFSQTQHDSSSTYSAYSNYGVVTSSLQASQEVTDASSSQSGTPHICFSPTYLYSPSSITPANTPSSPRVASLLAPQDQMQASYRAQTVEDELHGIEHETERRIHPFARVVVDCQRECRSTQGPRTSLPQLEPHSHLD